MYRTVPQAYSNNLVDHHLVLDLISPLSHAYFGGLLPAPLSYSQAAILACVGLQQHDIGKVCVAGALMTVLLHLLAACQRKWRRSCVWGCALQAIPCLHTLRASGWGQGASLCMLPVQHSLSLGPATHAAL
jgi:hypothetical protein